MKTKLLRLLVASICMGTVVQCKLPFPVQNDEASGRLIYKNTCQNQLLYLINLDRISAFKSGFTYKDSLTVYGVTYMNVIQIDTSQNSLLQDKKLGAKIYLEFSPSARVALPACADLRRGDIQSIHIINTGAAIY